jgi:two-component system, LuxR family, sensor kinase FixL
LASVTVAPGSADGTSAVDATQSPAESSGASSAAGSQYSIAALLSHAFDALPNPTALLDEQGCVQKINPAWQRFAARTGVLLEPNEVAGQNYIDVCRAGLLDELSIARARGGLEAVLSGRQSNFVFDYPHLLGNSSNWFELHVATVDAPTGGVLVSHMDITKWKQAEIDAANRLNELAHVSRSVTMGALAGSAAHELNQPLTAILSNAQAAIRFLAADPPRLEMVRDILSDIAAADLRASEIIRRIRRLLHKGEPEERVAVDVNNVVRDALQMLADEALLRKVRTSVVLEPALPPVAGDALQLQQVVLNLALNSFEAMDDVSVPERQLIVRTSRRLDCVEISVHDCGPGVNERAMPHIFDPFFTTKRNGMGMGLYITRAIVESHGGRIAAARERNRGLCVSVTLPAGPVEPGRT